MALFVVHSRAAAVASLGRTAERSRYREKRENALMRANRAKKKDEFLGCCGSKRHHNFVLMAQALRDHRYFQGGVIAVILMAGVLVGVQLYRLPSDVTSALAVLDLCVLVVFWLEIVVKVAAEGRYPLRFFGDAWNCFDFAIAVSGVLPFDARAVTALRLVRLLRVLKLVRALPQLRVLVMGLLSSMSSIAYIGVLLLLLFYLYAVVGVSLFGTNDPYRFGTLHISMLTLFGVATLEDWMDTLYTQYYGCDVYEPDIATAGGDNVPFHEFCPKPQAQPVVAVVYFISFVMLSSMIVLNLFIGIISTSIAQAKEELTKELVAEQDERDAIEAENIPQEDADAVIESRLDELSEIMSRITDEVEAFAMLEKQRKSEELSKRIRQAHERHNSRRGSGTTFKSANDMKPKIPSLQKILSAAGTSSSRLNTNTNTNISHNNLLGGALHRKDSGSEGKREIDRPAPPDIDEISDNKQDDEEDEEDENTQNTQNTTKSNNFEEEPPSSSSSPLSATRPLPSSTVHPPRHPVLPKSTDDAPTPAAAAPSNLGFRESSSGHNIPSNSPQSSARTVGSTDRLLRQVDSDLANMLRK